MINELINKKYIFFDIGYTLEKPLSNDWMFINKFYEKVKDKLNNIDPFLIEQSRNKGLDYLSKHHLINTLEEEIDNFNDYYSIINNELKLDLSDKDILEISIDRATNMNNYVIYDDSIEVLKELKKHYKLGVISDTWPSITNQLKTIGLYDYFDTFTFSFELGVFKPNKLMYLDALKKANCKPEDTCFIDDNINNLLSAQELGITPILIAANPVSDIETNIKKIHSLKELLD